MPYFRIVHKGVTHFIEADINQQALSQLGIASTADYQLKKITKEVYETGIKTKPPVTKSISTPFKTPDVSWSPVGAEPTATTPTTQEATTPTGDVDYSRATPASELTPGGTGEERFGVAPFSQSQVEDYRAYLAFLKTPEGKGWPSPSNIEQFLGNVDQWAEDMLSSLDPPTPPDATPEQGELTPDQQKEWDAYLKAQEDYLAQQQAYLDQRKEYEEGQKAYQEEQRAYQDYQRQEAYRETPRYGEAFTQWLGGQETAGGALQQFIEREYPSLQSEFGATQPRTVGYPTREAARAEAGRREEAWTGWLGEMTPEIEQRYYAQRPGDRGERLWMQAPNVRAINWS